MSILGDIEDGIKVVQEDAASVAHFIVKAYHTDETRIMVDLQHVEDTVETWLNKNAPSVTGDLVAMKADFLSMLKGI